MASCGVYELVNMGLHNSPLSADTKSLPETMSTYHLKGPAQTNLCNSTTNIHEWNLCNASEDCIF